MKEKKMYRAFKITKKNGDVVELKITKACAITTDKLMFNIEQMKDGSFKLIWSKSLCENFSELDKLEIVRED